MAFSFGFFDSRGLDRTYTAENFCDYLGSLICNGIQDNYGDCFSVTANGDLMVKIGTGKAWINGHYFINDSPYTLDLSRYVDESMSKYLIVGAYCDVGDSYRKCDIEIKVGTAATTPTIPTFTNTQTRTYLTLAAIRLNAAATEIKQSNITDYRESLSKCGYVRCILGKCKVSEMLAEMVQIRQDLSGFKDGSLSDAVKELQHYTFNTADKITFQNNDDGRFFYKDSDGNNVTEEIKIGGIPYQFAPNGVLQTGWRTVFGKRYYYDPQNGNIKLGWVKYGDRMYYVSLAEGKLVNQHRTIDGKRYWFDSYGVATESRCTNYPDADGDSYISASDATAVLRFSSACGVGEYTDDEDGWEKFLNDTYGEKSEKSIYPDVDNDGYITSADASRISDFYAKSTGTGQYTNDENGWKKYLNDIGADSATPYPDTNGDGIVDAVDASRVSDFYSKSTGTEQYSNSKAGWEKYLKDIENGGAD